MPANPWHRWLANWGCRAPRCRTGCGGWKENGTIAGYAVKLGSESRAAGLAAMISLGVEPKKQPDVARQVSRIPQVETLYAVSGKFDYVAVVRANSAEDIDRLIDQMTQLAGVTDVETSVILSTKLDRR